MTDLLTDLLTDLPSINEKSFRFQNQKCLLTYKSHINKSDMEEFLKGKGKTELKKFYMAHETGDETTPYEHSHVVVDFGKAIQSRNSRFLDYKDIHPHISIIKTPTEWKKACKYLTKEDKTVELEDDDKIAERVTVKEIWEQPSIGAALENMNDIKDAMSTIAIYAHKPRRLPRSKLTYDTLFDWQKELYELVQGEPDDRHIVWIVDRKGKNGKSAFAKWACLNYPEKYFLMDEIGRITDFANNYKNKCDQGWDGDTIFINLVRDFEEKGHIYSAFEKIKDGHMTCTKYQGGEIWMPEMHLIIFANWTPMYEKLSRDRWIIYNLEDGKLERLSSLEPPCNIRGDSDRDEI